MAYATPQDVEVRLGRGLDETESASVSQRLEDAELLIRSRVPDLDTRVAEGRILATAVVLVESEMVLRLIRNPDGYTQETDGNYSYTISAEVSSGKLSVLGSEWSLLGIRGGVYSIAPYVSIPTAPPYPTSPTDTGWGFWA